MKIRLFKNQIQIIVHALNESLIFEEKTVQQKFKNSLLIEIINAHEKKLNLIQNKFTISYSYHQLWLIISSLYNYEPRSPYERAKLTILLDIFYKALIK